MKKILIISLLLITMNITAKVNNEQKLIIAVRAGNLKRVKNLIASGAKITTPDVSIKDYNALTWAAVKGFEDIFKLLITQGEYIGKTPYSLLKSDTIKALINGNLDLIKARINRYNLNEKDIFGWNLLLYACSFGKLEIINHLINLGADINSINSNLDTPLILAAKNGHFFIVKLLVDKKAKIDLQNKINEDAIISAFKAGNLEIAKYLLSEIKEYKNKEIFLHMLNADNDKIKEKIKTKQDAMSKDVSGWTPLMYASATDNLSALDRVLSFKPGLNVKNKNGETALFIAAGMGNLEIVKFLTLHGADINVKNNQGWSALMNAIIHERTAVIKYLLSKNPKIDTKPGNLNIADIAFETGNKELHTIIKKRSEESKTSLLNRFINWIKSIYREIVIYLTATGFLTLVLTIGSGIFIFIGLKILLKFLSRKIQLSQVKKEVNRIIVLLSLIVSFKLSNLSLLNNYGIIILTIFLVYYIFKISEYIVVEYYLIKKKNRYIPKIIRDIIKVVMFFVLLIFLLRALDVSITGIALTSGGIAVGIGFALRDTFNNLIAGISISVEKPFRIGDWIKVKGEIVGEVIQTSWRTTRLLTLSRDLYIIPNTEISNSEFFNFYKPRKQHGIILTVGISYDHAPNLVKDTIKSILIHTDGISNDPAPKVTLMKYNDSSMDYEIRYWISNYPENVDIQDTVLSKIWYTFKRKDLVIPFPIRTIEYKIPNVENKEETPFELFRNCPIFENLEADLLKEVIKDFKRQKYGKDELIVAYDEVGPGLYIIEQGELDVITRDKFGNKKYIKQLTQGDFFGELSLITGSKTKADVKAKTDCVLLFEERSAFKELVKKYADLLVAISNIADSRLDEILKMEKIEEINASKKPEMKKNVLKKIFDYFEDV